MSGKSDPSSHPEPSFPTRLQGDAEVIMFGDSLTAGTLGIGYRRYLPQLPGIGYRFRGINGDTARGTVLRAEHFLASLPAVRSLSPGPALTAVLLECGSNDLLLPSAARTSQPWQQAVRSMTRPGREPLERPEALLKYLAAALDHLLKLSRKVFPNFETHLRLAVMTLPPLGEDLDSSLNVRRRLVNIGLREIARSQGVSCIDPEPLLETELKKDPLSHPHDAPGTAGGQESDVRSFFPTWADPGLFQRDARIVDGDPERADALGRSRGLRLTVDGLHANSIGARLIASSFLPFLQRLSSEQLPDTSTNDYIRGSRPAPDRPKV